MGSTPIAQDHGPLAGSAYQVVNLLAHGARSRVYCAQHGRLGHLVAVKAFSAQSNRDVRSADRTRIEGQIGARLRHPNLVAVHDLGTTTAGADYLAMDLLRGESLRERLGVQPEGRFQVSDALDIACQILAALQLLHDTGLVHRDLKPDNIFLCEGGAVKVLDLGLAKVVAQANTLTPDPLIEETEPDVVIGSARYMAPEQASRQPVDARADLYALGCILYQMLAGRGPFDEATTPEDMRAAHISRWPRPPSSFLPAPLPPALDGLVLRSLHKSPERRPARADLMAAELWQIGATSGDSAAGTGGHLAVEGDDVHPSAGNRLPLAQLLLLVLASLTVGALMGSWLTRLRWA